MAKLSDDVVEELEAIQAIFGSDYHERPPVWNYPSFAINIRATNSEKHSSQPNLTVRFQLSATYPKTGPKYEIEQTQGLSLEEKKNLSKAIEETIKLNLNSVMIYEIVSAIQNFIDHEVQSFTEESFYDSMMRREQEHSAYIQNLKKSTVDHVEVETSLQKKSGTDILDTTVVLHGNQRTNSTEILTSTITQGQAKMDVVKPAIVPLRAPLEQLARKPIEPVVERIPEVDTGEDEEDGDGDGSEDHLYYDNSKSRYTQEFQEIKEIGNGASGQVLQVRHNLDRRIYAVKKIDLNARNNAVGNKIQREVTTISRLIHKNIVRYYAAWIEQYEATNKRQGVNSGSSNTKAGSSVSSAGNIWITGKSRLDNEAWGAHDHSGFSISFEGSQSDGGNKDLSNFGINHTIRPYYEFDSSSDESDESDSDNSEDDSSEESDGGDNSSGKSKDSDNDSGDLFESDSGSECSQLPKVARWMFIQMEYCCTTLREEIDKKELWTNNAEINRLMRQMLEGLAYMHKCKVIHRDLKPANIFLDAENNIKIGDFGLATTGNKHGHDKVGNISDGGFIPESAESSMHAPHDLSGHSGMHDALESLTAGIGTALYRAPEQELIVKNATEDREYHVPYNEKADMYSLGIILFEMCHKPFGTGMERLVTIKELRENGKLPIGFETEVPENLVKIIQWLTQRNPQQRPTAQQLLNSDLMPARADVDSQYLKEITEALYKPNSAATSEIVSVLFDCEKIASTLQTQSAFEGIQNKSIFYDYDTVKRIEGILNPIVPKGGVAGQKQSDHQKMIIPLHHLNAAKRRLRCIFESRGGVDFYSQLLELRSTADVAFNKELDRKIDGHIVELLDRSGQVVVMQPDLLTTFTRLVAFLNITSSQRFCFDRVFAADFSAQRLYTQPITVDNAVYDIVSPAYNHGYLLLADVEILSTVKSILHVFQTSLPPTAIRLSHSAIEEVIISICCWDGESAMKDVKVTADISRKIRRILTQIPEYSNLKEIESIIENSGLSSVARIRLLHFGRSLMNQDITGAHDPLRVLKTLETEFYGLKEISSSNSTSESKELSKSKDVTKTTTVDNKDKAQKGAVAKVAPVADFTPINLDHIGVKGKAMPTVASVTTSIKKEATKAVGPEDRPKRDRGSSVGLIGSNNQAEIVKEWAKLFERGLQHLKDVLRILALQKSVKDMCNANTSTVMGDLSVLENTLDMQSSNIIIDFGVPSASSPFETHPYFHSEGIRFYVESYTLITKSFSSEATGTKLKKKSQEQSSATDSSAGGGLLYKRFKRNFGCWMDGGHFEDLIYQRRNQLNGREDSSVNKLIACGLRIHLENLISVVHKMENRLRSKQSLSLSTTKTHHKTIGNSERLIALVVNATNNQSKFVESLSVGSIPMEETFFGPSYCPDAKSLSVVTNWLQIHHIRSSYNIHQLQGYTSVSSEELVRLTDIPVLVTVDAEHYDHVAVQILNGNALSAPQTISLQQLPAWIKVNVNPEYFKYSLVDGHISGGSANTNLYALGTSISTSSSMGGVSGGNPINTINAHNAIEEENGIDRIFAVNVVTPAASSDNDVFGNKKKKKELDLLLVKLSTAFTIFGSDRPIFKAANEVIGKGFRYTSVVEVVDIPLLLLRSVNTLLMSKASNSTAFKAEFDALVSQEPNSSYRKVLKQFIIALVNFSQSVVSKFSEPLTAQKQGGGKIATPAKSTLTGTKQLIYTFSPVDDYLDSLFVIAEHIVNLRSVL